MFRASMYRHCTLIMTTERACHEDFRCVIAEALDRARSLPGFGANDYSAVGRSLGSSSDSGGSNDSGTSFSSCRTFCGLINSLDLFYKFLCLRVCVFMPFSPSVGYGIDFIFVTLRVSFAPFFFLFSNAISRNALICWRSVRWCHQLQCSHTIL